MEILASIDIQYICIKLCRYLIADPIFHYICYALHYMYTSQDSELTTY